MGFEGKRFDVVMLIEYLLPSKDSRCFFQTLRLQTSTTFCARF